MRRNVCLLSLTVAAAFAPAADAAELGLHFPGLKPGGQVAFAVFSSEKTWKSRTSPALDGFLKLAPGEDGIRLQLPPGRYAVMAYHDRNANGRLDVLPIGLPVEPYGFSNNARGSFGPPAFSAAAFDMPAGGGSQTIKLR